MKKFISILLIISMITFVIGCSNSKNIEYTDPNSHVTKTYRFEPIGIFNMDEKNPNIYYSFSLGNIFWCIVFSETIIIPIILIGWYLWEPEYQTYPTYPLGTR